MIAARVKCQWCGADGSLNDFEFDNVHRDGFWCPFCDGHTYLSEDANKDRRILLILESKTGPTPICKPICKLQKRLSPLRYPGGKSKIIDFLSGQFRKRQMYAFVEVFAGGASVGLSLLQAGIIQRLVLNDTDPGVYAFWKALKEEPKELLTRLAGKDPTLDDFRHAQEVLDHPEGRSLDELAWSELICNRLGYSGITKAGPIGGWNGTQQQLLSRWKASTLSKRIRTIHAMAGRITVTRLDAKELLEQSAYWDQRSTCFIDPPYVDQGGRLYREFFKQEDHKDLAWMINSLYQGFPGTDIIITYDECELVRNLYPYAEIVEIGRNYSCNTRRKTNGIETGNWQGIQPHGEL